jgi:hypothetical protein
MVLHRDDNKSDPSLGNLRYGTHAENLGDGRRNGRKYGRKTSATVALDESVVAALKGLGNTYNITDLSRLLGVSRAAINGARMKNWSHVDALPREDAVAWLKKAIQGRPLPRPYLGPRRLREGAPA